INYFEGPTGANNAKKYLSMIVERSLPAAKAQSYMAAVSADKESFQNAIMEQRGLEFCGEMLRKADLIRWNKLGSTLAAEKQNMTELMNRTGIYATLPNNIYWKTGADGETAEIYGLELNQTDEEGATIANATKKSWNGDWSDKINGLYVNNPDDYQFWPIWQTFINASNGLISNDYNY
ncbi:MAG: RagB/SusD family nutrient uptake outer membrane protein, partial [Prevotella sp.]